MVDFSKGSGTKLVNEASNLGQDGIKTAHNTVKRVAKEFNSTLSEQMKAKSRFGYNMYLYAILAYGFFAFESAQNMLLLLGWVIIVEKNKALMRVIINALALYLTLKVSYGVIYGLLSFVYKLFPTFHISVLELIKGYIGDFKNILYLIFDFAYAAIGFSGMLKSRKGNYFKVGYIEKQFE